ncbi:P-loop containing nucleoside triphosphate hydrolase protein [Syncephalis fuscata]|nr:P-loop containing nucleoside triphosphate hydrolase protein [Syncephalis fuscata]
MTPTTTNSLEAKLIDEKETFASYPLDSRLLRALAKLGYEHPTLVQAKAIPLALTGKDLLARARTGSGKTLAYLLPTCHKILQVKSELTASDESLQVTRALILVPTRELAEQVTSQLGRLLMYCSKQVRVVNLAGQTSVEVQRSMLAENPDIIVATPSRVLPHLRNKRLILSETLETLVIDEADLVLSFGYEEDVRAIVGMLPKIFQSFLMSATLTRELDQLKQLVLRNPAILKLEESEEDQLDLLTQYSVSCSEAEKFLLIYVILKLRLIKGKIILFVNEIDRCYRLKLYLEQFSIKTCVLNSELPLNSRYHIVEEFNKGVYDYIIATDEASLQGEQDSDEEQDQDSDVEMADQSTVQPTKKRKRAQRKDKEYGVTRGVDFVEVAAVFNVDFPGSARAYTHRIGRTARAGKAGVSLSFVVPKDAEVKEELIPKRSGKVDDEAIFAKVKTKQSARGAEIKPYNFDMKQVNGFRYRMEDALRAVTKMSVREARIKELKAEIIHSEKLKAHFEDKPKDLEFLRHDRTLHPARVQPHMKNVPKYLLPKIKDTASGDVLANADTKGLHDKPQFSSNRRGRGGGRGGRGGRGGQGNKKRKNDPLKSFKYK